MSEWRLAKGAYAAALKAPCERDVPPAVPPTSDSNSDSETQDASGDDGSAGGRPPQMHTVTLRVNGQEVEVTCGPSDTLGQVLNQRLGLSGVKLGCGRGECGACTVLVDEKPILSCMTLAVTVADRHVETVEGLSRAEPGKVPEIDELSQLQQAFLLSDAYQCGYCTPGFIMAAEALLRREPAPTRDQIIGALAGNICRCGAYGHIVEAISVAADAIGHKAHCARPSDQKEDSR